MCAAVLQYDAPRCRILNVTVRRWNADGICVGGESSDTLISGCICERNHGIGLHPGAGIRDARILGNVSRYNEYGLLFCQGNRNVTVSHNTIHGNEKHGIWGLGEPDRYCIVSDNCVFDNGWHGIEVHGGVGNIIRGNLCRNNSRAEPGRYAGISLRNHRANLVVGNLCLDDQEIPTQIEGIRVEGPADENLLAANAEWRLAPAASSQA